MSSPSKNSVLSILDQLTYQKSTIENERKEYEKVREEITALDKNINEKRQKYTTMCQKLQQTQQETAKLKEGFHAYELKQKVIDETCEELEKEIKENSEELRTTRKEIMDITSKMLQEGRDFCLNWNCTDIGFNNRQVQVTARVNEAKMTKRDLEFELSGFLNMKQKVDQEEQQLEELKIEFKEKEAYVIQQEEWMKAQILIASNTVQHLQDQEAKESQERNAEFSSLNEKIQESRKSVSDLENKLAELKAEVQRQHLQNKRSATTAFGPNIPNQTIRPIYRPTTLQSPYRASNYSFQPPTVVQPRTPNVFAVVQTHTPTNNSVIQHSSANTSTYTPRSTFQFRKKVPHESQFLTEPLIKVEQVDDDCVIWDDDV